jgi:hypothetical protein
MMGLTLVTCGAMGLAVCRFVVVHCYFSVLRLSGTGLAELHFVFVRHSAWELTVPCDIK